MCVCVYVWSVSLVIFYFGHTTTHAERPHPFAKMHTLIISHFRFPLFESGCVKGFIVIRIEHTIGIGRGSYGDNVCPSASSTSRTLTQDEKRKKRTAAQHRQHPGTIIIYSDKKIHCIWNGKVSSTRVRVNDDALTNWECECQHILTQHTHDNGTTNFNRK